MKLYDYFQSSAAYRVRIALNLKAIAVEREFIDLTQGVQRAADYAAINPQMLVPSLVLDNGTVLTQSFAIMEYLEEAYPTPSILPPHPAARAQARAIALALASDIGTLNNLKIRHYLAAEFQATELQVKEKWIQHWVGDGLTGVEALLSRSALTGPYCVGDAPSIADCCLIPQLFSARRFGCDLTPFPTIRRIAEVCEQHPAFVMAHPANQPDAK